MKFKELQKEIGELQAKIQELQSTSYVIYPVAENYKFISFMDLETLTMGYTIVDNNMNSVDLVQNIPVEIMIEYGKFMNLLEDWQKDPEKDFPFSQFVADKDAFADLNLDNFEIVPEDHQYDGDEGRLR